MVENHLEMVMSSRVFLTIYTSVQRTDTYRNPTTSLRKGIHRGPFANAKRAVEAIRDSRTWVDTQAVVDRRGKVTGADGAICRMAGDAVGGPVDASAADPAPSQHR